MNCSHYSDKATIGPQVYLTGLFINVKFVTGRASVKCVGNKV